MVKKERCSKCGRWKGKNHRCPDQNPMKNKKRPLKKAGNWKDGLAKTSNGYIWEKCPKHPFVDNQGYVLQHRLIMEKYIKRFLLPNEIVHHINEDKGDNRIENLQLLNNLGEHNTIHKTKEKLR